MKAIRYISASQSVDQFFLGGDTFPSWFRCELERCMFMVNYRAGKEDQVVLDWEFEFRNDLWDIEIEVTGLAAPIRVGGGRSAATEGGRGKAPGPQSWATGGGAARTLPRL